MSTRKNVNTAAHLKDDDGPFLPGNQPQGMHPPGFQALDADHLGVLKGELPALAVCAGDLFIGTPVFWLNLQRLGP